MGHIQILRDVPSRAEGFSRTLRIFTPARYDRAPHERFGVLYMHDGQNVFEHPESVRHGGATWAADVTLEGLIDAGRIGPWIIVAVDHGLGRFEDYSPWDEPRVGVRARGERYARFLIDELKPWVDAAYRTRPEPQWTGAMGSSLGGLISLYLGLAHADVFGRIGAMSPSVMWSEDGMFRHWRAHTRRWTRLYIDAGTFEQFQLGAFPMPYGEKVRAFCEHLRGLGYGDHELRCVLESGGEHSERDWARRLPEALSWLLG
ncbi:MAG: alpha/beta hydrolase [Myxococcaceae bacterium]|nr:alpha/beta hydrolase [Myxococcaceae bacterium]